MASRCGGYSGEGRLGRFGGRFRPRQANLPGRRRVPVDPDRPQADGRSAAGDARVCAIPREQLRIDDLSRQIEAEGFVVRGSGCGGAVEFEPRARARSWQNPGQRRPVKGFAGGPRCTDQTHSMRIFSSTLAAKSRLSPPTQVQNHFFKPYLRARTSTGWEAEWWVVDDRHEVQWKLRLAVERKPAQEAESVFQGITRHSTPISTIPRKLVKRQDQGEYWWELRACVFWEAFSKAGKFGSSRFNSIRDTLSTLAGLYGNNKTTFSADRRHVLARRS